MRSQEYRFKPEGTTDHESNSFQSINKLSFSTYYKPVTGLGAGNIELNRKQSLALRSLYSIEEKQHELFFTYTQYMQMKYEVISEGENTYTWRHQTRLPVEGGTLADP